MEASSSRGRISALSPERTKVWTEPKPKTERKVSVVYYLSRNGHLEHPHCIEVPLSSPQGLHLRDVISRLNVLRGHRMTAMYSWSAKRSYRNGFVWQDLSENDFIYPTQGQEYILKGSEILQRPLETASSRFLRPPPLEFPKSEDVDSDFPLVTTRRRNQSWSSIDLHEYRVYKSESSGDSAAGKVAADASTQTDDKRRRRRPIIREENSGIEEIEQQQSTELSREEISPPPSDSSPETLETLMKADGRLALCDSRMIVKEEAANLTAENYPSGRMKASSVIIQLLSCGSVSFKDCGPTTTLKDQGLSLIGHYKSRMPRVAGNQAAKEAGTSMEIPDLGGVRLEDKEYFSGSLIETKKVDVPALKRSSSYNADRGSQLQIRENGDAVRAKCMPRKSKTLATKKEASGYVNVSNGQP